MKTYRTRASGSSIVEVMVTLLLFSTSALGLSLLLVASLKASNGAYLSSSAVTLAYNMNDRMRANIPAAIAGDYNQTLTQLPGTGTSIMALDIAEWRNTLSVTLPQGIGSVQVDPTSRIATIVIEWQDNSVKDNYDQTASATTNSALTIRTQL